MRSKKRSCQGSRARLRSWTLFWEQSQQQRAVRGRVVWLSAACLHGTFIAGLLSAKRSSPAPAICPDCTLLIRPIFAETTSESSQIPSATPQELAEAIFDCVKWGVQIINLSAALVQPSRTGERELGEAITYAADRGVMIVAAGGNQGVIGSTVITRHPWVIPVAACDLRGKPLDYSNLGNSISRHGLSAPGEDITSLGANGRLSTFSGTSAAAPFVTGAIALLWSEFPGAKSAEVKHAVTQSSVQRRATVVPPLLDAWEAHEVLKSKFRRRM